MEEIGGGGTDVRPTQIALVVDAGGNCVGDNALTNASRWSGGERQAERRGEIHYNQLKVERDE